jgi:hypothetical protein
MKNLVIGLFLMGVTAPFFAQVTPVEQLSEVFIVGTNYRYLDETGSRDVAVPVKELERKVATFNLEELDVYEDETEIYDVSFIIPEGKILATYNNEGKILRTIEKFKQINLPESVTMAVMNRFPGWAIAKNVYLVKYFDDQSGKKLYKLILENGDVQIKVKTDDLGNFL